jgi:hypothetical protein
MGVEKLQMFVIGCERTGYKMPPVFYTYILLSVVATKKVIYAI